MRVLVFASVAVLFASSAFAAQPRPLPRPDMPVTDGLAQCLPSQGCADTKEG